MTRFLATNRTRICPICDDHTGDCRITIDGNILCHTNAYHDAVIKNWQFIKTVEPAPWGFFVPVAQSVHQQRQLRKVIVVEKNQQELEQKRFALSASEFDREFRRLKQPTGLDKNHAQDLFRRGFLEKEIKIYGFFSIAPRQDAVISVKRGFPGISEGQFTVAKSGYTVPFFNSQGLIHGYQIRLDNLKDSRYRWAKGDFSSHIVKINKFSRSQRTFVLY